MGLARCIAPDWFGNVVVGNDLLGDQTCYIQKLIARGRPKEVAKDGPAAMPTAHPNMQTFEIKSFAPEKTAQQGGCMGGCFS
jgi:hypothetical protein